LVYTYVTFSARHFFWICLHKYKRIKALALCQQNLFAHAFTPTNGTILWIMETAIQKATDAVRAVMQGTVAPFVDRITNGKLHPDTITMTSFLMHIPIAYLIATRHNLWAALLLFVFGLLDALDGALARTQNRESAQGTFLDSTTDRMKEILLYSGAAFALVATGHAYLAAWAVAACGCSLLTSYMNAWGDAVMSKYKVAKHVMNKSFRGGLFPFQFRMFVLVVGLLTNNLSWAVIIVAVGAAYTAVMRMLGVLSKLREAHVQS
jgi:phosphatidylglycerophosphate synthase